MVQGLPSPEYEASPEPERSMDLEPPQANPPTDSAAMGAGVDGHATARNLIDTLDDDDMELDD